MGYAPTQKGYKVYDIEADKFIVSRDVIFKENVFPFKFPRNYFFCRPDISPIFLDSSYFPSYSPVTPNSIISPPTCIESTLSQPLSPILSDPPSLPEGTPHTHIPEKIQSAAPTSSLSVTLNPTTTPPERSGRTTKPSIWMTYYVHPPLPSTTVPATSYPLQNFVSYSHLPTQFQFFLASFSSDTEPSSYSQVIRDDRWIKAMKLEIETLENTILGSS